ncbi:MAG: membrane protein insertase YidC [Acutalibacteraceae bacterium]|nr:membrane protein insertase YidC [Oscillospiraceae bacterium]
MQYYYQIFGWILKFIYNLVGNNYALALIVFTLFFRLILLPSTISQQKGAAKQMRMQAKVNRIQEKYKDYQKADKQQLIQQETQALYQKEGYSSMTGGCLPLLIQLPIMWGLYGAVYKPLSYILGIDSTVLQKFVDVYNSTFSPNNPVTLSGRVTQAEMFVLEKFEEIVPKVKGVSQDIIETIRNFDFTIFGIPLFARPSLDTLKHFGSASATDRWLLLIPLLSALTSLMTSILTQKRQEKTGQDTAQMKQMSCMMMFMMPLMSLWITFSLPAAVGIYWIISNVLAFLQTLVLGYTHAPRRVLARLMVEETIERRSKEENIKLMAKNNFEN